MAIVSLKSSSTPITSGFMSGIRIFYASLWPSSGGAIAFIIRASLNRPLSAKELLDDSLFTEHHRCGRRFVGGEGSASRADGRALPDRAAVGRRRHGRGLSGARHAIGATSRAQAVAARPDARP